MEIRVLGSYGSRVRGHHTSSLLINRRLLLDAGTVSSVLSLEEQVAIDEVLLTHAHLDHRVDLPFLVDNTLTLGKASAGMGSGAGDRSASQFSVQRPDLA